MTKWGSEAGLRELLGDGTASLQMTRQIFVWQFASAEHYLHLFQNYYGPTVKAFEALDESGRLALAGDLLDALGRLPDWPTAPSWSPLNTWRSSPFARRDLTFLFQSAGEATATVVA